MRPLPLGLVGDALVAELLAGCVCLRGPLDAHCLEHPWRLDELDVSVVDNLNVVAPGIQEVEGAASLDVNVGVPKRRADPLLVIDDEAEVPASVVGLRSASRKRDELIPHVNEGHRCADPAAQLELEEASVPGERLVDLTDLKRDVIDPDEACHRSRP